jgi:hypothetical protein
MGCGKSFSKLPNQILHSCQIPRLQHVGSQTGYYKELVCPTLRWIPFRTGSVSCQRGTTESPATNDCCIPGMNCGFLKNQSMTRMVKLRRTAAWWKVMGPSSWYLAVSILRTVRPSAMSSLDFLLVRREDRERLGPWKRLQTHRLEHAVRELRGRDGDPSLVES